MAGQGASRERGAFTPQNEVVLTSRCLFASSLRRDLQALDANAGNAVVVHLNDGEAAAPIFDRLTCFGNIAELEE